MLSEERYGKILDCLNKHKTVTVAQLVDELGVSESTIRRDLIYLDSVNKIIKVHGGATVINDNYDFTERPVEAKQKLFAEEKDAIAKYAASTIRKGDFVFLDAGTTTEKMIDYITETTAVFVTNGFSHAKRLAHRGFKVYLIGGEIKATTEAIVGAECVEQLRKYNFVKAYLGTNGISVSNGFTTPDPEEASVKRTVAQHSYMTYILADHSKFDQVSPITFCTLENACIITDKVSNETYLEHSVIKEVMK